IGPTASEAESQRLRRSLYVVEDVRAGDVVTEKNVRSIRPAGGLEPRYYDTVMGRTFRADAAKGTALSWDLI
ncbi:MAG: SAF domain-containing protein, partial [Dermabacter sp.]|nr:SAF domain-containing protein [Dermabacter sp.]